MAVSRILSTLAVLMLTFLVVTVCSYPLTTNHKYQQSEGQAIYEDLLRQAFGPKSEFTLPQVKSNLYRHGGAANGHDLHDFRWSPERLQMMKQLHEDAKEDIGKRDYGDLGFFFGKRGSSGIKDQEALERQNRDYGDLGMFFGKRNANEIAEERNTDFADFAA